MSKIKTLEEMIADPNTFTSKMARMKTRGSSLIPPAELLLEEKLTAKEEDAIRASIRRSKKKPPKSNLKNIPARDQAQTPPYAILPLLPYIPKDWIVWESAASKYGFLGEAIRALNGNTVIETGMESTGDDFFKVTRNVAQVQITNPPFSLKYEWIERSYDNRQAFALLMPFDTWAAASAQKLFQRFGVSVIILNRRVHFHMPNLGWGEFDDEGDPVWYWDEEKQKWKKRVSRSDYAVAWFTWGLPFMKEPVTYGHIPLEKHLPQWMVRPGHKSEITKGAKSMEDRLAIKRATTPLSWPGSGKEAS